MECNTGGSALRQSANRLASFPRTGHGTLSAQPIVAVTGLSKEYAGTVAMNGASFGIGCHEILGLLGPNGARKTTTINMILGMLEPSAGRVTIDGRDLASRRRLALERTNFAAVYAPRCPVI
jgi:ABC-2 type transport system ATP-binding protein